MRAIIEPLPDEGIGLRHGLKLLDGYRAGNFVRAGTTERPLSDIDPKRLTAWASETGYDVGANMSKITTLGQLVIDSAENA